jgi:hypothetical protein
MQDLLDLGRQPAAVAHGFGTVPQHGHDGLGGTRAKERRPAGEHLEEDGAKGEDVGAMIGGLAAGLFRREVGDGADDGAGRGLGDGIGLAIETGSVFVEPRQAEVENLHHAVAGDEDVLRLEIAMGDAALMGGGQPLRDLMSPVERAADFELALLQPLAQRGPFEQLHDRVERSAVGPEVVNGEDVRMRQRRDGASLPLEPRQGVAGMGVRPDQNFDGDVALQTLVARPPDLPHPARADAADDLVRPELRPDIHR